MKRKIRTTRQRKYYVILCSTILGMLLGAGIAGAFLRLEQQKLMLDLKQKESLIATCTAQLTSYENKKKQLMEQTNGTGREVWIDDVFVNDSIREGDRIDIRISYTNAEDYVVLSNKLIQQYDGKNGMVLLLTEEEILMLSSALIDTRRYEATALYAVTYPELAETISNVTYLPNHEVAKLLHIERQTTNLREQLEERLQTAFEG